MGIMTNVCSLLLKRVYSIYKYAFSYKIKVAVIGLESTGKSTFVYSLLDRKFQENCNSNSVRECKHTINSTDIVIWDIPGSEKYCSRWDHYYNKSDAMIFAIDSTNVEQMKKSREALHHLVFRNMWIKKPILVIATKNDLPESSKVKDIILDMDLTSIVDREIALFSISSKDMSNIDLAEEWLTDQAEYLYQEKV